MNNGDPQRFDGNSPTVAPPTPEPPKNIGVPVNDPNSAGPVCAVYPAPFLEPGHNCGVRSWIHYDAMKADGFNPEDLAQCKEWERLKAAKASEEIYKRDMDWLENLWVTAKKETDPIIIMDLFIDTHRGCPRTWSTEDSLKIHKMRQAMLDHLDNLGVTYKQILDFVGPIITRFPESVDSLLTLAARICNTVHAKINVALMYQNLYAHVPVMFSLHCVVLHEAEAIAKTPEDYHALEVAWQQVPPTTVTAWTPGALGKRIDATKAIQQRVKACRKKAREPIVTVINILAAVEPDTSQAQMRLAYGKAAALASTAEDWQRVAASIESDAKRTGEDARQSGFDAESWARKFRTAGSDSDSVDELQGWDTLCKNTEKSLLLARRYARVTDPLNPEHVRRCWNRAWRKRSGAIDLVLMAVAANQAPWIARTRKRQLPQFFVRKAIGEVRTKEDWIAVGSTCRFLGDRLCSGTMGIVGKGPGA